MGLLFATTIVEALLLLANIGEIGIEIGVERNNLGDVPVEFLNQRNVFDHVIRHPRLLILVHLLNQETVAVEHRLNLPEALVHGGPGLGVAVLGVVELSVGIDGGGARGGGGVAAAAAVVAVGGVFHGGFGGGGR